MKKAEKGRKRQGQVRKLTWYPFHDNRFAFFVLKRKR
jgi:hypothetical protein